MPFTALHSLTKRVLAALLLVLQIGFVNGEALLMAAAEVEHHSIIESEHGTVINADLTSTSVHDIDTHHCDICHGHAAHFAMVSDKSWAPLDFRAVIQPLPATSYLSLRPNSIDRPPIASV